MPIDVCPSMDYGPIIGQTVKITYRHMRHHHTIMLLLLTLTTAAYTAAFIGALHLIESRGGSLRVVGWLCSTHAAAAWLLTAFILCCCLAILGRYAFRDKKVDLSLRLLYGGGPGLTIAQVGLESILTIVAALFLSLAAGEWWLPVLTNCRDLERYEQVFLARYLIAAGTIFFVVQFMCMAGLPIYTLIRSTASATFKTRPGKFQ